MEGRLDGSQGRVLNIHTYIHKNVYTGVPRATEVDSMSLIYSAKMIKSVINRKRKGI